MPQIYFPAYGCAFVFYIFAIMVVGLSDCSLHHICLKVEKFTSL